jgi:PD-(D/E)XK endonuclease
VLSSNRKGAIAETKIAAAATELDVPVLRPITEHARYDLAFEIGDEILRVQCKWGALDKDGALIKVGLRSSWCTPTGYEQRQYNADEIDLVAVYCGDLDRCYLLPHELAIGRAAYGYG